MKPKGTACPSNRGIAVGRPKKFEPAFAPPACKSCPHRAFGRCCVCVCGLVKGVEVGAGDEGERGGAWGGGMGDSEGTRRGTRRGLAGDFRGTRALFWGLAQRNGAFSSGFRGTRPRPRRAFIILKGGSEVLEVACGVLQSSTADLHLKIYGPLAQAFSRPPFVAYASPPAF